MKKRMKKRIFSIFIILFILTGIGCSSKKETVNEVNEIKQISFKDTVSLSELKKYDGKEVTINGYLATSSPADGSFIFLMNLPYQSCPFCIPNTSELANTLEVYPKKGETFGYTTSAVKVTGTLEFCKDGNFTDAYGYEFGYKLVDAEYVIITDNADMSFYQTVSDAGLIDTLYGMFDYVYLVTCWSEYFYGAWTQADGQYYVGAFMSPSELPDVVAYDYGIDRTTYFDDIYSVMDGIGSDRLDGVRQMVEKCEALAEDGYNACENGEYTSVYGYFDEIGGEGTRYYMNDREAFSARFNELYDAFSLWINSFAL